jgi:hypothetical protein
MMSVLMDGGSIAEAAENRSRGMAMNGVGTDWRGRPAARVGDNTGAHEARPAACRSKLVTLSGARPVTVVVVLGGAGWIDTLWGGTTIDVPRGLWSDERMAGSRGHELTNGGEARLSSIVA